MTTDYFRSVAKLVNGADTFKNLQNPVFKEWNEKLNFHTNIKVKRAKR